MIIYGWVTDTSIIAAFLSTVGPGIMVVILFSIINLIWVRKFKDVEIPDTSEALPIVFRKNLRTTAAAIPALSLPVIILGGIYGGIFTPTEAAAVAAVVAVLVGFFHLQGNEC